MGNQDGQCLTPEEYQQAMCADFEDVMDAITYIGIAISPLALTPLFPGVLAVEGLLAAIYIGIDMGLPDYCENPMDE